MRFLYHWLSPEKLSACVSSGSLKPYWRHWIADQKRFARGISTAFGPTNWVPDEGLPRETCLIIDRSLISAPQLEINSGNAYHDTHLFKLLRRRGVPADIAAEEIFERARNRRSPCRPDEVFVEGVIEMACVVAIGFEFDPADGLPEGEATEAARTLAIPLIDMTEWVSNGMHFLDAGQIIEEMINEYSSSRPHPKPA